MASSPKAPHHKDWGKTETTNKGGEAIHRGGTHDPILRPGKLKGPGKENCRGTPNWGTMGGTGKRLPGSATRKQPVKSEVSRVLG